MLTIVAVEQGLIGSDEEFVDSEPVRPVSKKVEDGIKWINARPLRKNSIQVSCKEEARRCD